MKAPRFIFHPLFSHFCEYCGKKIETASDASSCNTSTARCISPTEKESPPVSVFLKSVLGLIPIARAKSSFVILFSTIFPLSLSILTAVLPTSFLALLRVHPKYTLHILRCQVIFCIFASKIFLPAFLCCIFAIKVLLCKWEDFL